MFLEQISTEVQLLLLSVLTLILGYISRLVGKVIGVLANKAEAWLDAKLSASQREILHRIGQEAFAFAETTYRELNGEEKLMKARDYVIEQLRKQGITVSEQEIKAIIENAVLEFNRGRKEVTVKTSEIEINPSETE